MFLFLKRGIDFALLFWLVLLPAVSSAAEDEYLVAATDEGGLSDEFAFLEMEDDVIESAARHRQEIGMSPSAITVVTREDIKASGATTLPDLLRMVPGMDVVISCPATQAISARLYWSDENLHFLVLVDGRDATVELLGQPAWIMQPILLEDIERIEVIRGPGSSLYGANAMAGVVSITTRAVPEKSSAWARVIGGEAGKAAVAARASARTGNWGFSVSGEIEQMGTFIDPSAPGIDSYKIRAFSEYRLSEARRVLLDGSYTTGTGPYTTGLGVLDAEVGLGMLRLAYQSEGIRGHLYWTYTPFKVRLEAPLDYAGIRLARFASAEVDSHVVDGEVQWTLPGFWDPLLLIVGAAGRVAWLGSDQLLDADTYADVTSPRYHQPGLDHLEGRTGAFVHAELAPIDWVTVTGGVRFDYNTVTGPFVSPRLAGVFRPAPGQFVRLGVARAFRKPAVMETHFHLMAEFPDDSPITGPAQEKFQEFMTRVVGNSHVEHEQLTSFEAGYLGQFLDGRLAVALDLYYNLYREMVELQENIVVDEQGLPNLDVSRLQYANIGRDLDIFGGELAVRYEVAEGVRLLASWSHRQSYNRDTGNWELRNPKNLITLGGRFISESGLLGSLYLHSRSDLVDVTTENPTGILAPYLRQHLDNYFLVLGKLGWVWLANEQLKIEAGVKIFLPVSPFSGPLFRYHEKGGGVSATGRLYGGFELARMVTGYLQGSF